MTEQEKQKKAMFDEYVQKKMEEIRLELEDLFPKDKPENLLGGFAVALMMQVGEESPPLFNGVVQGLVRHRNELLPHLAQ